MVTESMTSVAARTPDPTEAPTPESTLDSVAAPVAETDPDWIRDAWEQSQLRAYLLTFREVTLRPGAFASEYVNGRVPPMGPWSFFVTGSAADAILSSAFAHLWPDLAGDSFFESIVHAVRPYVTYGVLAVLVHLAMRLLGSRRALRSTVAIALYIGGGPAAAFRLITNAGYKPIAYSGGMMQFQEHHYWLAVGLSLVSVAGYLWFFGGFARALAKLHRVRMWTSLAVLAAAFAVHGAATQLAPKTWSGRLTTDALWNGMGAGQEHRAAAGHEGAAANPGRN